MARLMNLPDWSAPPRLDHDHHFHFRAWLPALALTGLSVLTGLFMAKIGSVGAGLGALAFLVIFYTGLAVVPGAIYGYVRDAMRDEYMDHRHFWEHAAFGSAIAAALWLAVTLIALIVA